MGRHSSPEQGAYYRSFIVWALPWVMIVAVVLVAVWIAIDAVGGDELTAATRPPQTETQPAATQQPTQTAEPVPSESQQPKKKKRNDRPPKKEEPVDDGLITDGISVQVLNGTGAATADDRMADRLSRLGYQVVAIDGSSRQYSRTTVFWSYPSAREAAERLAERFGWLAALKPDNLSSTVDIHVVVGGDET